MTSGEPRDGCRQSGQTESKGTMALKWGGFQKQNGNGNVCTALSDYNASSHTIQFNCVIIMIRFIKSPCAFHSSSETEF
jgi:hypothetical protein